MLRPLVLMLALTAGCSQLIPSLGGPNVAANTQIGRENTQTVGQDRRSSVEVRAPVETVDQSETQTKTGPVESLQITNIPPWVILLLLLGWLLPSPNEMARAIQKLFRRRS